jgi:hypothetical protein
MTAPPPAEAAWDSLLVQILRFGGDTGVIRANDPYLVARGDEVAEEYRMELDHEEFLDYLDDLRYVRAIPDAERRGALDKVAGTITRMLAVQPRPRALQVDLVINAKELAALPFEAVNGADGRPLLVRREPTVELTRRVRGAFRGRTPRWPAKPHVLLISSAPEEPVPLEAHEHAMRTALTPWIEPLEGYPDAVPDERHVLTVLDQATLASIADACREATTPFSHVHVLAHGTEVAHGERKRFGLRLWADHGREAADVTADQLVEALGAGSALPTVVSVTACDSADVGSTIVSGSSVAHALHAAGVPVVVASQFPLTFDGSTLMVETFYGWLLAGADVRDAIHRTREELYRRRHTTGHDWMSLVAYVQLPEGYIDHLLDVRLQAELASLQTAQLWADHLARRPTGSAEVFEDVAGRLRDRIANLERWAAHAERMGRSDLLEENHGLLGSAHKRLAELYFCRAGTVEHPERSLERSRRELEKSRVWYARAFAGNFSAHWLGVQQLSLEAVLHGAISQPWQWHAALQAARVACETAPDEVWGCGSRAELHLLAPYAGEGRQLEEAERALSELADRRPEVDSFPVESTARQLRRYATWWTAPNGFFPGTDDLAADAELVAAGRLNLLSPR